MGVVSVFLKINYLKNIHSMFKKRVIGDLDPLF